MTQRRTPDRRDVLRWSATASAAAISAGWPHLAMAQTPTPALAPAPMKITPELIEAAKKEGRVNYYTSVEIKVAERIAKAFETKYPGIAVKVERTGAERNFQRIGQEYAAKIFNCDTVNSSDAAHFIIWKRDGLLEPVIPEDVAQHYGAAVQGRRRRLRDLARDAERHRLQHHPGEAGRRAERASPTCSIRSGPARWSRRILAIPAPS